MEVFGGVFILRRVTAAHMPADKAQTQVNPGIASLNAVFAHMLVGLSNLDLVQVSTFFRHFVPQENLFGQVTTVM